MPAQRLHDTPTVIRRFDVAGQDSEHVAEFVRHVGLAPRECAGLTRESSAVRLVEMRPPLSRDDPDSARPVQTIGTAELTSDEQRQIAAFIDELSSEYEGQKARGFRQYIIRPHATEPNEQFPFRRFSCAGFVVEAYRDAGIELLELDEAVLPDVSLQTLKQAYGARMLHNEQGRARLGLEGNGPWRVVLAGYVMCAMARDAPKVRGEPHQPRAGDAFFPP